MNRDLPQLTYGTRYVFFSSLDHEPSSLYTSLASHARDMLYDLQDDIKYDSNNTSSNKINTALSFLQKAAQFERAKESQFFSNFQSKYPNAESIFNINLTNPSPQDYINFIANINNTLKGITTFKNRLNTERQRLYRIQAFKGKNYESLYYNKNNLQKRVAQANDDALTFFKRGGKSRAKKGSGEGGESTFRDIFQRRSNMSELTSIIIQSYGVDIFDFSKNKLTLSPRKTAALIKALSDEAYAMFISENEILTENSTIQLRNVILGPEFESFVKDLLNAPDLSDALEDIADQYNLSKSTNISGINSQIDSLKSDLLQSRGRIMTSIPETMTTDEWLNLNGISDNFLKQIYKSTLTVSAQAYYVGEDLALIEQIRNRLGAVLGGGANPTDDIYAGELIITINGQQNYDPLEQELKKIGREAYKNIKGLDSLETFFDNAEKLRIARQQQQNKLDEISQNLDSSESAGQYLLSHINIHTTIKGYTGAESSRFKQEGGFGGASFGSTLPMQLNVLQQMSDSGGISIGDLQFLQFACVNAGQQMIGHFLKPSLENYFSIFVGFLMFNDAELMFEDVTKWTTDMAISGVNDIHLYELNGITFPSSYILENTYQALVSISSDLAQSNQHGVKAKLTTYDGGPINHDWEETSEVATAKTKMEIRFLAGFLDILDQISQAMPN